MNFFARSIATASTLFLLLPVVILQAQGRPEDEARPLTFRAAVDLALKNSAATGIGQADLQRANASVRQGHGAYIPQMVLGSGLGGSYGFPLSLEGAAPSIFNVNVQSALLNLAQRDYIRAAKSDVDATTAQNADRRNDVIMETALAYVQLDLLESSLSVQREQRETAAKFQGTVEQRIQAGLDSQVELTRAKLAVARTRFDITQAQGAADQLRLRLSQLTGLPVTSIHTSAESVPELPAVAQNQDMVSQAVESSPLVKTANDAAKAKEFRAEAERKQLYPAIDLVAQYAVLARFNNYDQFFQKFQRHNVTGGVAIRFPFLNPVQHAAAEVAHAEAVKSRKEARAVKEQVSTETLRMQRTVEQLSAARDVAQLEHQLSRSDIDAAQAKITSGGATLKDEQSAIIAEHQRYTAYLSSTFDLEKAQVQLLRQTGQLETWALGPPKH